ncbi:hypothetical protein V428_13375 [Aeromonas hydrophila subsp. hydrophila AL09-71]|nr:hypothetical protein V428_13375 [Aeromonas hydrophila subsp. hydrophila AL09-71]AHX69828.1 hypothetical protein V429_13395 [Aeromonas hydrophila pc104A]AXV29785.1 hypothetical protein BFW97_09885 [Aeromonas hydrophila]KYQ12699.1 hypothetical protein AW872_08475 [Aeromonas hydrophila]KYQ15242.1 hypothetical protein AW873_08490 [Aeromonas hydrophila]
MSLIPLTKATVQCAALIVPYLLRQSDVVVLLIAMLRNQSNKGGDLPPTLLMHPFYITARSFGVT